MPIEEMTRMPATGPLFRRAITGFARPGGGGAGPLSATELRVTGVGVSSDQLYRYSDVCGFRLTNTLPATYPHVLAFPLTLDLMTRPTFPFAPLGLVHIQNTIELVRPVDRGEHLDLSVRAENLRAHERGRAVDVVITATVDNVPVWHGRSTYLRRDRRRAGNRGGSTGGDKTPGDPTSGDTTFAGQGRDEAGATGTAPTAAAIWRIDPGVAREYARVSGDRNPIHTSTVAARAFGFPRRIAHGMWTKARCLAALEGRLPDSYAVDVVFKLPVLLPATVALSSAQLGGGGRNFALQDASTGRPHLAGSVTVRGGRQLAAG